MSTFFILFIVIILLNLLFFRLYFFYNFILFLLIFQFMILTFITNSILFLFIVLYKIIDSSILILFNFFNISARHTLRTICLFLRFQEFSLSCRINLHIYLPGKCWLSCRSHLIILIHYLLCYIIRLNFSLILHLLMIARAYLAELLSFTIKVALL